MRTRGRGILPFGLSLALLGTVSLGMSPGLAQDATPEAGAADAHPAHIHAGNCQEGELGDIVAPLTDLAEATGDETGQSDLAVSAASSFTNVPLPLDAILADDHAVNVHLSADEIGTYIACGEIGGVLGGDGSLVIGLKEYDGSGYSGIAFLGPAEDGVSTNLSVFVAEGLSGGSTAVGGQAAETPEGTAADDATPVATGGESGGEAATLETVDFAFEPDTLTIAADSDVELTLTNNGDAEHNLTIEELSIDEDIEPGETTTVTLNAPAGDYDFFCEYHQRRMTGTLTVE